MSTKRKSIWTRNLVPGLTITRILGAGLLFVGIRSIHAGELKTRGVHFQGAMGYVAGITCGAEWNTSLLPNTWTTIPDAGIPPQHAFSVPVGTNKRMFMRFRISNP